MTVVVCGEALVDLVLERDGRVSAHPGGGPYNVARTIGRLEQAVAYLGCISGDRFGTRLREQLVADGVETSAVVSTEAHTTLAVAEIDGDGAARYRFYEAGTSAPGLTVEDATAVLPATVDSLYVGTLGLVFEPMATTLEALVDQAPPTALVAIDPNCRPSVIADEPAYRARLGRLLRRADVVKASEEDLAFLHPDLDPVAAARMLLGNDDAVALVTLGARGAVVVWHDGEHAIAGEPVTVVDTIGAGDAFMGAFLARGLNRADLTDRAALIGAAGFACRVASLTCARAGADPPRRSELA